MLKQVSYFTEAKPLSIDMSDFFPLTKRISMDLDNNLPINVDARLPYGTPKSIVSRIQPMHGYTTHEMTEVVSFALILSFSSLSL